VIVKVIKFECKIIADIYSVTVITIKISCHVSDVIFIVKIFSNGMHKYCSNRHKNNHGMYSTWIE
jgi:hypothetical protein